MEKAVGFEDIIKKNFANIDFSSGLNTLDIIVVLLSTFLMGMFIFYIYKKTFQGVLYTEGYNISLVMVSLVTSLIIMTISSNFVLSLGMVGALSIVRFRTAIKDSMDIVFMFWAISIGIANGAGFFQISVIGSLIIAGVLIILTQFKSNSSPYLLILNYSNNATDKEVMKYIKDNIVKFNLKSKTITHNQVEITIEIRLKNDDTTFVNTLSNIEDVTNVVLVSYNGDYVS
jgi:uncharacterized membrane protein YhiD involved in acid resistance